MGMRRVDQIEPRSQGSIPRSTSSTLRERQEAGRGDPSIAQARALVMHRLPTRGLPRLAREGPFSARSRYFGKRRSNAAVHTGFRWHTCAARSNQGVWRMAGLPPTASRAVVEQVDCEALGRSMGDGCPGGGSGGGLLSSRLARISRSLSPSCKVARPMPVVSA